MLDQILILLAQESLIFAVLLVAFSVERASEDVDVVLVELIRLAAHSLRVPLL